MIEAQEVTVSIGGRTVLEKETVHCAPGAMTALIGPSGCGKTTLLHCLGLLLPIDDGYIKINGNDVTNYKNMARRQFWRDYAAFVLQDYGIMDEESVAYNITMKASFFGENIAGNKERLEKALKQANLQNRENELAGRLSGGEKQRLALARAIYKDAEILFVDEPTASLDVTNRQMVIKLFEDFAARGCTVIVSTHDSEVIQACSARHKVGSNAIK